MSAGAVGTPQILMLSGIGDRSELTAVGIRPIVHLPSVGKNMSDHVLLLHSYHVNSTDTLQDQLGPTGIHGSMAMWDDARKGPLSYTIFNHGAFLRLPPNDSIFDKYQDPAMGPTSSHYQLIFGVCESRS